MTFITNLYSMISTLKKTKRQGWIARGLDADTIASHIYGAMSVGFYLAEEEKVNVEKVVQMLLVHDWVMSKIEDVTPQSGKYDKKRQMEEEAKEVVKALIPEILQEKYLLLFNEFNMQLTEESKVAREADKLDTLLQGETFEIETNNPTILNEFLITYENVFKTESGKAVYSGIKERHEKRINGL